MAEHLHVPWRYGQACRVHDPDGWPAVKLSQRTRRKLDGRSRLELHPSDHGRTQAHGFRCIGQADLDLEGPRHRVSLRRYLAHPSDCLDGRIIGQVYANERITRSRAYHLCRHVEHRIAAIVPGDPDDHLSGLNHLPRFNRSGCDHAGGVDPQVCAAQLIFRHAQLRLGGLEPGACGLQRLLGALELSARRHVPRQKKSLAREFTFRLGKLRLRGGDCRLRRTQGVDLVLRVESRNHLIGLDPVTDVDGSLDHAPANAKGEPRFVLRLDPSGEGYGLADVPFGDSDCPNRTRFRDRLFCFAVAAGEQRAGTQQGQSEATSPSRSAHPGHCRTSSRPAVHPPTTSAVTAPDPA